MKKSTGDVLTIDKLAIYLKIPKSPLYKLAREGMILSRKIGRRWCFWKGAVKRWFERERNFDPGSGGNR